MSDVFRVTANGPEHVRIHSLDDTCEACRSGRSSVRSVTPGFFTRTRILRERTHPAMGNRR